MTAYAILYMARAITEESDGIFRLKGIKKVVGWDDDGGRGMESSVCKTNDSIQLKLVP